MFYLSAQLSRLAVQTSPILRRSITTSSSLWFRSTPILLAEPLKKKKKLDPSVIRAREERRKKKLEKQIRRLEKVSLQLKPIEECEPSLDLIDTLKERKRILPAISEHELEERALLTKEWARYKHRQHEADVKMFDRIMLAQQKALDELRFESEELYQAAIEIDTFLIPFTTTGPAIAPPIENYEAPDGDYHDVSKKWE